MESTTLSEPIEYTDDDETGEGIDEYFEEWRTEEADE